MENSLPIEIWQIITNLCNSINHIIFCQISKFTNANIHVTDFLHNLKENLLIKLNDEKISIMVELIF